MPAQARSSSIWGASVLLMSTTFWLAFLPLLFVYFTLSKNLQNLLLLAAGLAFMAWWSWWLPAIHLMLAGIVYVSALRMFSARERKPVMRRYLGLCVSVCVGTLILIRTIKLLGIQETASSAAPSLLGAGISFTTLQTLGYLIEVYRRRFEPTRSFSEFVMFTSFFPIVMMGPIERFRELAPQFARKREFCLERILPAFSLISLGVMKKLAIADPLFPFVNNADPTTDAVYGIGLAIYCLLCVLHLYADFSSYIDLARGISWLLGIRLTENFNRPYVSEDIADVWHRWHISLMRWTRDFIYLPLLLLTKNVYVSIIAVMLFTGLWHDFSVSHVLWAAYWSFFYCLYVFMKTRRLLGPTTPLSHFLASHRWIGRLGVFCVMVFSSLVFLKPSVEGFVESLERLARLDRSSAGSIFAKSALSAEGLAIVSVCTVAMIVAETLHVGWKLEDQAVSWRRNARFAVLSLVLIFLAAAFGVSNSRSFIYLRY